MEKLQLLESVLGSSTKANRDYYQFHCPFCNHPKKKLGVSLGNGTWKCWVCPSKGSKVSQLLFKLKTDGVRISKAKELWSEKSKIVQNEPVSLQLPKEFLPLSEQTGSFFYRKAKSYLNSRGVNECDIIKHRIGYCEKGSFSDMVVFPYYSQHGTLTHFMGRTFFDSQYKFKEPVDVNKNIIGDENLINWQESLILVESKLDAIAVRRNAVPLNGKQIPERLKQKIITEGTPKVIFCLDGDALDDAIRNAEYFIQNGIEVERVELPIDQDPNSLGFEKVWEYIYRSIPLTNNDIFKFKILTKLK